MSKLTEKLKEPFDRQLNEQSKLLGSGWAELEEYKEVIYQWPARKGKIVNHIIKPMQKWIADLKKMARPLKLKRYKRAKRRLRRTRHATFNHWPGFRKGLKLLLLETLNITRILLILFFYIAVLLLLGFVIMKIIGFIGDLFGG